MILVRMTTWRLEGEVIDPAKEDDHRSRCQLNPETVPACEASDHTRV